MKKFLVMLSIIAAVATATLFNSNMVLAAGQLEDSIPKSGLPSETLAQPVDLCGGTGGNGQIVSVEKNAFTLKRNNDGSSQIIRLTNQATIKISTGPASFSDLKTGDRVTLVGGPNRDGSFTADTVLVCNRTQENVTDQEIRSVQKQRTVSLNKVNKWGWYINVSTMLLVSLIWISTLAFLRLKKKKSFTYLLFFTVFYVYIAKVLDYTLFQYQSLILLKHFTPGLILNGQTAEKSLNFIPLITLKLEDVRTSLLNILLMIPFGFGLPFITNFRFKKVVIIGALFSISIEFVQLITGLMAKITFRISDINDVIFNIIGAAIGYTLFVGFLGIYRRHVSRNWNMSANPILRYIAKLPQKDQGTQTKIHSKQKP